jgi:hypothetical protein
VIILKTLDKRIDDKKRRGDSRKIIIGDIFLNFFPEFGKIKVRKTVEENEAVFEDVYNLIGNIAYEKALEEWEKDKKGEKPKHEDYYVEPYPF